jgi:hypothetical protein
MTRIASIAAVSLAALLLGAAPAGAAACAQLLQWKYCL